MSNLPWTPWHKVVQLRDDLKSGKLPLAIFAADLYDVIMGKAKPVYQDAEEFFALTYPTFNIRELVKDVIVRLKGQNEKAVRQLELTYGGGKTHTLITLYHLVNDPKNLPDLPSVKEFIEHAGTVPPKARVAVISFDKLDVEKGMEILEDETEVFVDLGNVDDAPVSPYWLDLRFSNLGASVVSASLTEYASTVGRDERYKVLGPVGPEESRQLYSLVTKSISLGDTDPYLLDQVFSGFVGRVCLTSENELHRTVWVQQDSF